ncbi:hypothetical protein ES703_69380 [subsurface metagenome]
MHISSGSMINSIRANHIVRSDSTIGYFFWGQCWLINEPQALRFNFKGRNISLWLFLENDIELEATQFSMFTR